eukprot:GHVP01048247.1.p1 GENE.GHVP01048247.1~~GHVP01048247.1.p1  ORF type:complete len:1518 (+),score=229.28 GHVP01048247.1:99-4652(+)
MYHIIFNFAREAASFTANWFRSSSSGKKADLILPKIDPMWQIQSLLMESVLSICQHSILTSTLRYTIVSYISDFYSFADLPVPNKTEGYLCQIASQDTKLAAELIPLLLSHVSSAAFSKASLRCYISVDGLTIHQLVPAFLDVIQTCGGTSSTITESLPDCASLETTQPLQAPISTLYHLASIVAHGLVGLAIQKGKGQGERKEIRAMASSLLVDIAKAAFCPLFPIAVSVTNAAILQLSQFLGSFKSRQNDQELKSPIDGMIREQCVVVLGLLGSALIHAETSAGNVKLASNEGAFAEEIPCSECNKVQQGHLLLQTAEYEKRICSDCWLSVSLISVVSHLRAKESKEGHFNEADLKALEEDPLLHKPVVMESLKILIYHCMLLAKERRKLGHEGSSAEISFLEIEFSRSFNTAKTFLCQSVDSICKSANLNERNVVIAKPKKTGKLKSKVSFGEEILSTILWDCYIALESTQKDLVESGSQTGSKYVPLVGSGEALDDTNLSLIWGRVMGWKLQRARQIIIATLIDKLNKSPLQIIRRAATVALGRVIVAEPSLLLQENVKDLLTNALKDSSARVRERTLWLFLNLMNLDLGTKGGSELQIEPIATEGSVKDLIQFLRDFYPKFLRMVDDQSSLVRSQAVRLLAPVAADTGETGSQLALQVCTKLLSRLALEDEVDATQSQIIDILYNTWFANIQEKEQPVDNLVIFISTASRLFPDFPTVDTILSSKCTPAQKISVSETLLSKLMEELFKSRNLPPDQQQSKNKQTTLLQCISVIGQYNVAILADQLKLFSLYVQEPPKSVNDGDFVLEVLKIVCIACKSKSHVQSKAFVTSMSQIASRLMKFLHSRGKVIRGALNAICDIATYVTHDFKSHIQPILSLILKELTQEIDRTFESITKEGQPNRARISMVQKWVLECVWILDFVDLEYASGQSDSEPLIPLEKRLDFEAVKVQAGISEADAADLPRFVFNLLIQLNESGVASLQQHTISALGIFSRRYRRFLRSRRTRFVFGDSLKFSSPATLQQAALRAIFTLLSTFEGDAQTEVSAVQAEAVGSRDDYSAKTPVKRKSADKNSYVESSVNTPASSHWLSTATADRKLSASESAQPLAVHLTKIIELARSVLRTAIVKDNHLVCTDSQMITLTFSIRIMDLLQRQGMVNPTQLVSPLFGLVLLGSGLPNQKALAVLHRVHTAFPDVLSNSFAAGILDCVSMLPLESICVGQQISESLFASQIIDQASFAALYRFFKPLKGQREKFLNAMCRFLESLAEHENLNTLHSTLTESVIEFLDAKCPQSPIVHASGQGHLLSLQLVALHIITTLFLAVPFTFMSEIQIVLRFLAGFASSKSHLLTSHLESQPTDGEPSRTVEPVFASVAAVTAKRLCDLLSQVYETSPGIGDQEESPTRSGKVVPEKPKFEAQEINEPLEIWSHIWALVSAEDALDLQQKIEDAVGCELTDENAKWAATPMRKTRKVAPREKRQPKGRPKKQAKGRHQSVSPVSSSPSEPSLSESSDEE